MPMLPNEFEAAFDAFLERREYDAAELSVEKLVEEAFRAGWCAAAEQDGG